MHDNTSHTWQHIPYVRTYHTCNKNITHVTSHHTREIISHMWAHIKYVIIPHTCDNTSYMREHMISHYANAHYPMMMHHMISHHMTHDTILHHRIHILWYNIIWHITRDTEDGIHMIQHHTTCHPIPCYMTHDHMTPAMLCNTTLSLSDE